MKEDGYGAIEWKVYQSGPLCDSSLNGTGGGGAIGTGPGTGGPLCEGDSGTGAYENEPPVPICPEWYEPDSLVASSARPGQTGVLDVNIDTAFVDNLKLDNSAPVVCDTGRYTDGRFMDVQPGELFYELGFRNDDRNLVVQGFMPTTGQSSTRWFSLDSPEGIFTALVALLEETGLHFRLLRDGAPNDVYDIWVELVDCSGTCPAP